MFSLHIFLHQYPSETTVDDGDDLRWPEEEIQGVICSLALFGKSIYWSKYLTSVLKRCIYNVRCLKKFLTSIGGFLGDTRSLDNLGDWRTFELPTCSTLHWGTVYELFADFYYYKCGKFWSILLGIFISIELIVIFSPNLNFENRISFKNVQNTSKLFEKTFEVPQCFVGTDLTCYSSELSADSLGEPTCRPTLSFVSYHV